MPKGISASDSPQKRFIKRQRGRATFYGGAVRSGNNAVRTFIQAFMILFVLGLTWFALYMLVISQKLPSMFAASISDDPVTYGAIMNMVTSIGVFIAIGVSITAIVMVFGRN